MTENGETVDETEWEKTQRELQEQLGWKVTSGSRPFEPLELTDVDDRLAWLLRKAADEWGPTGVAQTAAKLAGGYYLTAAEMDE